MRYVLLWMAALVLAGCGTQAAPGPVASTQGLDRGPEVDVSVVPIVAKETAGSKATAGKSAQKLAEPKTASISRTTTQTPRSSETTPTRTNEEALKPRRKRRSPRSTRPSTSSKKKIERRSEPKKAKKPEKESAKSFDELSAEERRKAVTGG